MHNANCLVPTEIALVLLISTPNATVSYESTVLIHINTTYTHIYFIILVSAECEQIIGCGGGVCIAQISVCIGSKWIYMFIWRHSLNLNKPKHTPLVFDFCCCTDLKKYTFDLIEFTFELHRCMFGILENQNKQNEPNKSTTKPEKMDTYSHAHQIE